MTADVCAGLFLPPSSSGAIRTAGIIILICVTSSTLTGICIIGVLYGESALCSETMPFAWTNFKWSLCDVSGGYQYIKSPDVFMQMKRSSNGFLSIHIPRYLLPFLCVVFHFFCAVLMSAALFLFILHILLPCQDWEDRMCDRSERIGGKCQGLTQPLI